MNAVCEEQKETKGSLATIVFFVSALYLFIANLGLGSLLSLKALGFFAIGMFAAAIIIGIPAYLLQRTVGKVLMKTTSDPFSDSAIKKTKLIGVTLLLIQVIVTFIITKLSFQWIIL